MCGLPVTANARSIDSLRRRMASRGLNYLCAGYKRFFRHIDPYMRTMAELVESGRPADQIMKMIAMESEDRAPAQWDGMIRARAVAVRSIRSVAGLEAFRRVG